MSAFAHVAERLIVEVRTSRRLADAGLLARVGELNRRHWVPVIAQVLEGLDAPEVVRVDRLVLDLGPFGPEELDAVPTRLAERLRAALAEQLRARQGEVRRSSAAAMLDAFEHYLAQGGWPYGSGIDVRTAPGAVLHTLIEAEPVTLVAMLRARGGSELLLRRLVRQMPARVLSGLLHRLEPVHAAYVLAYVEEVRTSHREEPVLPASAEQLAEMLWTIVLRDALGQSGLQANRKAFLRRLLRGLAEVSGTPLSELLRQLRRGLVAVGRRRRAPGSLVEILGQLMAEEPAMLVDAAALDRLARYLFEDRRRWSSEQLAELGLIARAAWRVRPTEFAWLIRRLALARSTAALMRLEAVMPLEHALQALWPGAGERAAAIVEQAPATVRTALLAELVEVECPLEGESDLHADITNHTNAVTRRLQRLAAIDPGRLAALAGASGPDALLAQLLPVHLHAPLASFGRAAECMAGEWEALLPVAAVAEKTQPAELLLLRAFQALAKRRGVSPAALRRTLRHAPGTIASEGSEGPGIWAGPLSRRQVRRLADRQQLLGQATMLIEMRLGLGEDVRQRALAPLLARSPEADRQAPLPSRGAAHWPSDPKASGSRYRLAAALRVRPFEVLEVLGASPEAMVSAALGLAGLSMLARERVRAMGARLTGRAGRRAVAAEKVAQALMRAVAAADWRAGTGDFASEWLKQLEALASLSEQAALKRLLGAAAEASGAPDERAAKAPTPSAARLRARVGALLGLGPSPRKSMVRRAFADPMQRLVVAKALTERELVVLLAWVAPGLAPGLLHVAERIGSVRRTAGAPVTRVDQWLAVLMAATSDGHAVARLTSVMLEGGNGCPAPPAPIRHRVEMALARSLEGMRDAPLRIALDLRARTRKALAERSATEAAPDPMIWVGNAGLVLTSAYLPRLFETLRWTEADERGGWRWTSRDAQERAPHLLQWLVDGRKDVAEPELALPKLLCGLAPSDAIPRAEELDPDELRMARLLLDTIRANWPPLAESSVQALRETFLQRGGRLTKKPDACTLEVETKVLDVLLEQLPWGYSTIAHGWMPVPLTVRWR